MSDFCNPMDYSLPGSSVHGILQARILKWVSISFSKSSSWPRDQTQVSCIVGRFFTSWAEKEAQLKHKYVLKSMYAGSQIIDKWRLLNRKLGMLSVIRLYVQTMSFYGLSLKI